MGRRSKFYGPHPRENKKTSDVEVNNTKTRRLKEKYINRKLKPRRESSNG